MIYFNRSVGFLSRFFLSSAKTSRQGGLSYRDIGGEKPVLYRRARACPSPSFMHQTPSLLLCRSRAPALDPFREQALPNYRGDESSAQFNDRGGQAPALRLSGPSPFIVGRGPVPRHRSGTRHPPPLFFCRSGSPALDPFRERALPNYRWGRIVRVSQRSRGTGPRATVKMTVLARNDRRGDIAIKIKTRRARLRGR